MNELQIDVDQLREKRVRAGRYLVFCVTLIVIGLLSLLAVSAWKTVLILLVLPTLFAGYSSGGMARNWIKEFMLNAGRPPEDAELGSILMGVGSGLIGTLLLAMGQYLIVVFFFHIGAIVK